MRNILLYLFVMVMTAYIEIMYDDTMAITFLAFEILIAVVMIAIVGYLKRHIHVELTIPIPVVQKREEVELRIHIRNTGAIPASRISLWLTFENEYSAGLGKSQIHCFAQAKNDTFISYRAQAQYCGKLDFYLDKGRISDYLGLFGRKVSCDSEVQVNVLPAIQEIPVMVTETARSYMADTEEFLTDVKGDDPSEIFDIREFRDGDSLQRVHWKMSAKTDTMMTKEFSRQVGCSTLLLLELFHQSGIAYGMERMDAFMEMTASMIWSLCQAGVLFHVAWFDAEDNQLVREFIREEEQVYAVIDRLLDTLCYKQKIDLYEEYQVLYPESSYRTILRLDTNLKLTKNEQDEVLLVRDEATKQIQSVILEV